HPDGDLPRERARVCIHCAQLSPWRFLAWPASALHRPAIGTCCSRGKLLVRSWSAFASSIEGNSRALTSQSIEVTGRHLLHPSDECDILCERIHVTRTGIRRRSAPVRSTN